ncbi:hypothetical protein GCM10008090_16630 [Arenicella chitinivorans]|uniref:Uncharacterized protein n=1 Tax=Arenicella chitinivorans TaxID=1329800 RepID=A0A918VM40_9GAMM|nr:hypothetical protein GCM10008090_16630 [Arenicella chitinivorans]
MAALISVSIVTTKPVTFCLHQSAGTRLYSRVARLNAETAEDKTDSERQGNFITAKTHTFRRFTLFNGD